MVEGGSDEGGSEVEGRGRGRVVQRIKLHNNPYRIATANVQPGPGKWICQLPTEPRQQPAASSQQPAAPEASSLRAGHVGNSGVANRCEWVWSRSRSRSWALACGDLVRLEMGNCVPLIGRATMHHTLYLGR